MLVRLDSICFLPPALVDSFLRFLPSLSATSRRGSAISPKRPSLALSKDVDSRSEFDSRSDKIISDWLSGFPELNLVFYQMEFRERESALPDDFLS